MQLWKEFLIAATGGVEDGWEYVSETKGVLIHKKMWKDYPGVCVRGSGVVPISPDEVIRYIVLFDSR